MTGSYVQANKVSDLGAKMAETLHKNAEHASNTAAAVVDRADKWSSQSANQLEQLVAQLESHSKNTKEIENTLMTTLGLFNSSLSQYASLNAGLNKVANEVNAMASAATGAAQQYFADDITDALTTELGKVSSLRVISRQSVMRYKGTSKTLPEIARELERVFVKYTRSSITIAVIPLSSTNGWLSVRRPRWPLNELADVLLRGPNSLSAPDREQRRNLSAHDRGSTATGGAHGQLKAEANELVEALLATPRR